MSTSETPDVEHFNPAQVKTSQTEIYHSKEASEKQDESQYNSGNLNKASSSSPPQGDPQTVTSTSQDASVNNSTKNALSDSNVHVENKDTPHRTCETGNKNGGEYDEGAEEPLLRPNRGRYVIFPIQYKDIWSFYKKALGEFVV